MSRIEVNIDGQWRKVSEYASDTRAVDAYMQLKEQGYEVRLVRCDA